MMKKCLIIITILTGFLKLPAQENILTRPDILAKVENCLYKTYGWNFKEATQIQASLQKELPTHPAPYFLKALIIYWQNYPLLPENPKVGEFEHAIKKAIELSKPMINSDQGNMEGIFFDMHARAFEGMFWADNGKIAKVIPDLDNMYRSTMKGIEYKDKFTEFYFSSALYNYYMEAYVEKHPAYKPVLLLFRGGDKEKGLKELAFATKSTTYIKYEAFLFMALIQRNYEENLSAALDYIAILYNNFPDNVYYRSEYLVNLLYSKNYSLASALNQKLAGNPEDFPTMVYCMSEGFLNEKDAKNYPRAKEYYNKTIVITEKIGPFADLYAAIAYAGLSRIAERENDGNSARKFRRLSSQHSVYDFIIDF